MATYDLGTMPGTDPSPVVSLACLPHFTAVETMPWQASWCRRRFSVPLCLAHPAARRSAFLLFKEATQRAWKAHISGEQGTGMLIKDLAPQAQVLACATHRTRPQCEALMLSVSDWVSLVSCFHTHQCSLSGQLASRTVSCPSFVTLSSRLKSQVVKKARAILPPHREFCVASANLSKGLAC